MILNINKTPDSESTSNFFIELPETMLCPPSTVFYIDDVSIPHSWTTIEPGINSRLYLYLIDNTLLPITTKSLIIYLSDGNYIGSELAVEIQNKLNAAVQAVGFVSLFQVSYSTKTNTIQIATDKIHIQFYVLTPTDLKDKLGGLFTLTYDTVKPIDCNEVLGNLEGYSKQYDINTPFISGYINKKYLYALLTWNFSNSSLTSQRL